MSFVCVFIFGIHQIFVVTIKIYINSKHRYLGGLLLEKTTIDGGYENNDDPHFDEAKKKGKKTWIWKFSTFVERPWNLDDGSMYDLVIDHNK